MSFNTANDGGVDPDEYVLELMKRGAETPETRKINVPNVQFYDGLEPGEQYTVTIYGTKDDRNGPVLSRSFHTRESRNDHWAEPSPLFAHRARPTTLKCKNEYPVLSLGDETAVQAVVGSIICATPVLKKPRCREMSARGYALHSVCTQLSFSFF